MKNDEREDRAPRILVMEAALGSGSRAIIRSGGTPLAVSPRHVEAVDEALAAGRFDGVLLMGGGDVDPRLYGEKPHRKVYGVSEVRDYTEWTVLSAARDRELPVLGICRGSQLMAVHNGGRLKQHIGGHRGIDHLVFAETGTRFRKVTGRQAAMFVSLHHQVVIRTGNGWRVAGRDARGNIEAIESRDGRCIGVQFHPEMDFGTNEQSRRLFRWLVDEAAKRAGLPKVKRGNREPRRPASAPPLPGEQMTIDQVKPRKRGIQKGVVVSFVCRDCGLRFDRQQDRDDHEVWICGNGLPELPTIEPPAGHPDWMEDA